MDQSCGMMTPLGPDGEPMASVTVGGGLEVYGEIPALLRVQDYIMLGSTHPVEREDVRRSLMRDLERLEFFTAILLAVSVNRAESLAVLEDFIRNLKEAAHGPTS